MELTWIRSPLSKAMSPIRLTRCSKSQILHLCFTQVFYLAVAIVLTGAGIRGVVQGRSCHERPEENSTAIFRCRRRLPSNDAVSETERDLAPVFPWIPQKCRMRSRLQQQICGLHESQPSAASTSTIIPTWTLPSEDEEDCKGSLSQSGNFTDHIHINTRPCYYLKYDFTQLPPVPAAKSMNFSFRYSTRTSGTTHIILAERSTYHTVNKKDEPLYEIVLPWNSKTLPEIRRCKLSCLVSMQNGPSQRLSGNETILVTYDHGIINVFDGYELSPTPFMTYIDPHPLVIRYVAVCKYSGIGTFTIPVCDSY